MSRISDTGLSSSTGLVSGIDIDGTVNQLIEVSARPRTQLTNRTGQLEGERSAIDNLAASVRGLESELRGFEDGSAFDARSLTSSSSAVEVSVAPGASPAEGSYQFTPLQAASSNQLVSDPIASVEDLADDGVLRIGFADGVDAGTDLAALRGGAGFDEGQIKITDRTGSAAVIDLRAAQSIDDVVAAINRQSDADVTASVEGDRLQLTDNSGGGGTLRVREVDGGTTAASLGLSSINATADTALGDDLVFLTNDTTLASLSDGLGVRTSPLDETYDLIFNLQDGSEVGVSLTGAATLGDVVAAINDDTTLNSRVTAAIDADGERLVVTDNSTPDGTSTFSIADNAGVSSVATALGLSGASSGGAVTGGRLLAGLQDTLVSSLNGGQGYDLGRIAITDASGASADVDLSGAETVQEILDTINAAATGVTARVNDSRNGITLVDGSTGGGNLVVAELDGGTTAADLGVAIDARVGSVEGGSLNQQSVSEASTLASYNGGRGVDVGDLRITDSTGATLSIDLNDSSNPATTIGDVLDRINAASTDAGSGVTARINDRGDGIALVDTSGGSGQLTVIDLGDNTAAEDLNLAGVAVQTAPGVLTIDGSTSYEIDLTTVGSASGSVALSSLNGGSGVDGGVFEIVDSNGVSAVIDLAAAGAEAFTVGDVIDQINAAGTALTASLNDAGTGVLLTDAGGNGQPVSVRDLGSGTAAEDLGLLTRPANEADEEAGVTYVEVVTNDQGVQTVDTGFLFDSADAETNALEALVDQINDLEGGFTASVVNDLNGARLSITADEPGAANRLAIDTGGTAFRFTEVSAAQNAVAVYGSGVTGGGVVVTSATNQFNEVLDGVNITVAEATGEPVTIESRQDDGAVRSAARGLVSAYNSIRTELDNSTFFNAEESTTGILFGTTEALRVDTDLSRVFTQRLVFNTDYGSLGSVGIDVQPDGTLVLDEQRFAAAFSDDPDAVERLFLDEERGAITRLSEAVDELATGDDSLLGRRSEALGATITTNNERIEEMTLSLEAERERLLLDYFRMEEALASLQTSQSYLSSLQPLDFNNGRDDN